MQSLKTLCSIVKLYEQLGEPTIAMNIRSMRLWEMKWMPAVDQPLVTGRSRSPSLDIKDAFEPHELDLPSSFACIATLESGSMNINSSNLQSVMALSSDDSLYIAIALLSDPAVTTGSKITRIRGNIGRAGIALLVPPQRPRVRAKESQDWTLVNFADFDGDITNCFQSTSLHASFTGFVLPLDSEVTGLRDTEIYLFETIISVHDKGRWVGDLRILPLFHQPEFRMIGDKNAACNHVQKALIPFEEDLTSIDSWNEYLDRPVGPVVFRAHGSWMARLAAASLSVQQKHLTLLFKEDTCWTCAKDAWSRNNSMRERAASKKKPIFIL
ncbi:MAG: hypothetical protein LQ350_001310 [Teloschistes chrysophthalmus]|nr:MAG: hypothetical protein LQ350_001310 [Niorma chrysophthalma]